MTSNVHLAAGAHLGCLALRCSYETSETAQRCLVVLHVLLLPFPHGLQLQLQPILLKRSMRHRPMQIAKVSNIWTRTMVCPSLQKRLWQASEWFVCVLRAILHASNKSTHLWLPSGSSSYRSKRGTCYKTNASLMFITMPKRRIVNLHFSSFIIDSGTWPWPSALA